MQPHWLQGSHKLSFIPLGVTSQAVAPCLRVGPADSPELLAESDTPHKQQRG